MTYFDQIDPINDIFDQSYANKPDWKNFYKFLVKHFFDRFPQIWTYGVIFTPKMSQFWPFSPKMTYFDQMTPLMTFLTKVMSINLIDIMFPNS